MAIFGVVTLAAGPCRAEWPYRAAGPTFSAEKNGATRLRAEKTAIHGINWHFSALPQ